MIDFDFSLRVSLERVVRSNLCKPGMLYSSSSVSYSDVVIVEQIDTLIDVQSTSLKTFPGASITNKKGERRGEWKRKYHEQ